MQMNGYQSLASETATYCVSCSVLANRDQDSFRVHKLSYCTLGLCGEAGEVANKVKKVIRDHNGVMSTEFKTAIKGELGDCLWYISQMCEELGFTLEDVAQANIEKLQSRQDRGVIGGSGDER